jgi:large subunit ribosomal protein L28
MLKICAICGKTLMMGRVLTRKGLAKKKGGTGRKTARTSKRAFLPNLQKIRILIGNHSRKVYVCSKCIKKGEIRKA